MSRYYGESMPFGNASFSNENLRFLSVEQALADYAYFLGQLSSFYPTAASCPVVAFGGSYGGMLSGWFRMKYPHVVVGAIAGSAPDLSFYGTGISQYMNVTSNTFFMADPRCPDLYHAALVSLQSQLENADQWDAVNDQFHLCPPIRNATDVDTFLEWLQGAPQYMAMTDYPYPNDFLEPVGASVVTQFCRVLVKYANDPVAGVADALTTYFNYTGDVPCYNFNFDATSALGDAAWDYQSCTEIVFPISSNGTSDMFLPSVFDLKAEIKYCQQTWGVTPNPKWYQQTFAPLLLNATNIVFTNGNLDPWSYGGIYHAPNKYVDTFLIHGGAHHLDLRAPVPQYDPPGVVMARTLELQRILEWTH